MYCSHREAGKYKARCVARGFAQRLEFEYYTNISNRNFANLLANAASQALHVRQMDVTQAFLLGILPEAEFMELLPAYRPQIDNQNIV